MASEKEGLPSEKDIPVICPRCSNQRVIRVLGAGGDYENWACPQCRPKDYQRDISDHYRSYGSYDGDAD